MTKRKKNTRSHIPGLRRIERKCDIILSELLIIRQQLSSRRDMDSTIERLHNAAIRMRRQCERERDNARTMFNLQLPERWT